MASPDRFLRTELLLGKEKVSALAGLNVAVIGLGAVGSYAVEALARAGVGNLIVADFDQVRETNFNRQLYAVTENLGRPKVDVARERILAINPDCTVHPLSIFIDAETVQQVFVLKPGVVIDAIDSVNPKTQLLAACHQKNLPVVSSMGSGNKFDPSLVRVGDIAETSICPLARVIRKNLKKQDITSGVRCVYSIENAVHAYGAEEEDFYRRGRLRRPIGTISYLPGIFGLVAAREALRLCGIC